MMKIAAPDHLCDLADMRRLRLLVFALVLSLPACHLVDQRDFDRNAGQPPVPPKVPVQPVQETPALITIRFGEANPPYQDEVTTLVRKALDRKPDARFTVATRFPAATSPAATADVAARAASSGRAIAETIVAAGAAPAQVEQEVAAVLGATVVEVQVFVR